MRHRSHTSVAPYSLAVNSAVHRPQPGPNLVIRAGFLSFFLHRRAMGCLFFAPRPDPGSSGAKKSEPGY